MVESKKAGTDWVPAFLIDWDFTPVFFRDTVRPSHHFQGGNMVDAQANDKVEEALGSVFDDLLRWEERRAFWRMIFLIGSLLVAMGMTGLGLHWTILASGFSPTVWSRAAAVLGGIVLPIVFGPIAARPILAAVEFSHAVATEDRLLANQYARDEAAARKGGVFSEMALSLKCKNDQDFARGRSARYRVRLLCEDLPQVLGVLVIGIISIATGYALT